MPQIIKKITSSESNIIFIKEEDPHGNYKDIRRRKPNLKKSFDVLGYKPKFKFEETLRRVVDEI